MRPMISSFRAIVLVAFLAVFVVGCQDNVKKENASLKAENADLKNQLAQANAHPAPTAATDTTQIDQLNQELAARDAQIKELQGSLRTPAGSSRSSAHPGMEGLETTYNAKAGTLTVNLPGDVLFASGQADLKSTSLATLDKVIRALKKDYAGKHVRVEGYTDTDPLVKTKAKWHDNLGLSRARADAVKHYLESHGVSASRVTAVGYGPAHPKATKELSRRVEIVVLLRDQESSAPVHHRSTAAPK